MIKTYREWAEEQIKADIGFKPDLIDAYNAGVKEAKNHYEKEFIAVDDYYSQKMRRTSGLSLEVVDKILELKDKLPEPGDIIDMESINRILIELKSLVK